MFVHLLIDVRTFITNIQQIGANLKLKSLQLNKLKK